MTDWKDLPEIPILQPIETKCVELNMELYDGPENDRRVKSETGQTEEELQDGCVRRGASGGRWTPCDD